MTLETIKEVEEELSRFSKRLKAAKEVIKGPEYNEYSGSRDVASLKRASMDLSNVLVKLRK